MFSFQHLQTNLGSCYGFFSFTYNSQHIYMEYFEELALGTLCPIPTSAKRSVIWAITHKAKMVYSTLELLAKEMGYLHRVLCKNNYPDWFLKNPTLDHKLIYLPPKTPPKRYLYQFPTFKPTNAQIILKNETFLNPY